MGNKCRMKPPARRKTSDVPKVTPGSRRSRSRSHPHSLARSGDIIVEDIGESTDGWDVPGPSYSVEL